MGDFEFLVGFYGLLLGLIVAEVASKLADAIDEHRTRPIGLLTPLLTVVVLGDITSFWMWVWSERAHVTMGWQTVYLSTSLGLVYFLSAALIFPRTAGRWKSLDEHYWLRKRWVIAGLLFVNAVVLTRMLSRLLPEWDDFWFFFWILTFFGPMSVLMFSRRRSVDLVCLSAISLYYAVNLLPGIPGSRWAEEIGMFSGSASTSSSPNPKHVADERF